MSGSPKRTQVWCIVYTLQENKIQVGETAQLLTSRVSSNELQHERMEQSLWSKTKGQTSGPFSSTYELCKLEHVSKPLWALVTWFVKRELSPRQEAESANCSRCFWNWRSRKIIIGKPWAWSSPGSTKLLREPREELGPFPWRKTWRAVIMGRSQHLIACTVSSDPHTYIQHPYPRNNTGTNTGRMMQWDPDGHWPSKYWVQLFRDVLVPVFDFGFAKLDHDVGIWFAICISWAKIKCLERREKKNQKTSLWFSGFQPWLHTGVT